MPRHFPDWLKAYCDFTQTSEAPTEFHFWTGVSTIAAVLRRRVWRDELLFKWTPNFYIIFVGPAGIVTKSTTLNIGYQLLAKVKGIHFGPDSMTWHGLAMKFQEAFEYVKYTNGTGEEEHLGMSPLTCSISELGTFLRPDDSGLVSFLTDVWDGKERPFQHHTKSSGNITVEAAWLNIIGATTPEWLQANFPPGLLQEGIGSRIVFVYGDAKRHLTAYPSQAVQPAAYHATRTKLIEDLVEIGKLVGPYDLTPAAFKWGTDWYAGHHNFRPTHVASTRFSGYLGRKQTHMHKLAMVIAASQRDALLIEQKDLEAAELILRDTERHMNRVFDNIGVPEETRYIAELVQYVRTYGWMDPRDLQRLTYNIMSDADFKIALKASIAGGLLEIEQRGNIRGLKAKRTIH